MNKYLLGSILALLGWSGLAVAQGTLGSPVIPENSVVQNRGDNGLTTFFELPPTYGPYAPPVNAPDSNAKPNQVIPENTVAPNYSPYAPSVYAPDANSKPNHPFLGRIAQTLMMPFRAATGRVAPETPTRDNVNRMIADGGYSLAEIAATKIKIDEAQVNARRAAVRYLASVDCHYFPEVEDGLIAALRSDRAEVVRYEAAVSLGNARALTPRMLEAMNMTALAVELDGNPAEASDRVRSAARNALHQCMVRGLCLPPANQDVAPNWLTPATNAIQPVSYYLPTSAPISPALLQPDAVTARPKDTPAVTTSRSFFEFMRNFTLRRDSTPDGPKTMDPRLRGLAPLGSEATLSISIRPELP